MMLKSLLFICLIAITGCATKIKSVTAELYKVEAVIDNPNHDISYMLLESSSGQISNSRSDKDGKLIFLIDSLILNEPDDYYIYISDGKENIPFGNSEKWKFKNPVWTKYSLAFETVNELKEKIEDTTLAIRDKEDGLQKSQSWLQNAEVFIDSECKVPASTKNAGIAGGIVGDMAAGAAVGSIVPGAGTIVGGALGFVAGLIGGEIVERAITAKADEQVGQCETVVKYANDCAQQIPVLRDINSNLEIELISESDNLKSEIERIGSLRESISESSAF